MIDVIPSKTWIKLVDKAATPERADVDIYVQRLASWWSLDRLSAHHRGSGSRVWYSEDDSRLQVLLIESG